MPRNVKIGIGITVYSATFAYFTLSSPLHEIDAQRLSCQSWERLRRFAAAPIRPRGMESAL